MICSSKLYNTFLCRCELRFEKIMFFFTCWVITVAQTFIQRTVGNEWMLNGFYNLHGKCVFKASFQALLRHFEN